MWTSIIIIYAQYPEFSCGFSPVGIQCTFREFVSQESLSGLCLNTAMEERIREIHSALLDEHGQPSQPSDMPAVDYIIHTILSQNTADQNRDQAWDSLVSEFGSDYRALEEADHSRLTEVIRSAGLANQKATRIQDALRRIRKYTGGEYSLEFIEEMDVEESREWLTNIKGIGPKTAGIVLLFCFSKPYFPVDTHCHRLAKRFQLIPAKTSAQKAHGLLTESVPDELMYTFHRLLIDHGRSYCTARNANCDNQVCRRYCTCEYC